MCYGLFFLNMIISNCYFFLICIKCVKNNVCQWKVIWMSNKYLSICLRTPWKCWRFNHLNSKNWEVYLIRQVDNLCLCLWNACSLTSSVQWKYFWEASTWNTIINYTKCNVQSQLKDPENNFWPRVHAMSCMSVKFVCTDPDSFFIAFKLVCWNKTLAFRFLTL